MLSALAVHIQRRVLDHVIVLICAAFPECSFVSRRDCFISQGIGSHGIIRGFRFQGGKKYGKRLNFLKLTVLCYELLFLFFLLII